MDWFSDLKDMKLAGSSLSSTVTFLSLKELIVSCERDYIIPRLGKITRDLINTKVGVVGATNDEKEAVRLYRKSLAFFVDYQFPTFRSIENGEGGSYRVETADKKTPFKYQEVRLEKGNLHEAYEALEELLLLLESSMTYKTAWALTPQYLKARSVFAYCAAVCREAYGYTINRYTFETLRPCIADTHRFQTMKQLPRLFYADLLAKFKANTLNGKELQVLEFLLKIETYYAIEAAMYKNLVKIEGQSLITTTDKDGYQQTKPPTMDEWRTAHSYHNDVAISYANELKEYVIANKTDFPLAISTDAAGTNAEPDAWLIDVPAPANAPCLMDVCGRVVEPFGIVRRLVEM